MTTPADDLAALVHSIQGLQGALLDAWVVVDGAGVIQAFNRPFFALFSRRQGRQLKGAALADVLSLRLGEDPLDLSAACAERQGAVRYDEVEAHIEEMELRNVIASATPLPQERPLGTFIVLRDVTDEARIQTRYKELLREEADARAHLEELLRRRTEELLLANDQLNALQAELTQHRKGLAP